MSKAVARFGARGYERAELWLRMQQARDLWRLWQRTEETPIQHGIEDLGPVAQFLGEARRGAEDGADQIKQARFGFEQRKKLDTGRQPGEEPVKGDESLIGIGADLVYSKRFADHHRFTQQEVLNVVNRSKKRQASAIITTQKDAVRFPKIDRRDLPIYFMRVEIKILSGANDFQDCVRKICFR